MMLTILGIVLLLAPFILVFYFQDRFFGFIKILVASTVFHLLVALVLQANTLFFRPLALSLNIFLVAALIFWAVKQRKRANFKFKFDWRLAVAALIIIFELFSVHYLYTGTITSIFGDQKVVRAFLPYPYFADEWAGVAFTKYSIESGSLPIVNPLLNEGQYRHFPNIFVGFFALLSEVFLVLNLDPLIGFPILAIVTGSLLCLLVYIFLRTSGAGKMSAVVAALSLPWIINSSKLPGLWYLFPFIGGAIFLLSGLIAWNLKKYQTALVASILSVFLYPPLIVLVAPAFLIGLFTERRLSAKQVIYSLLGAYATLLILVWLVVWLQPNNISNLFGLFFNSLIRNNHEGTIPDRFIWQVIPVALLPFALLGAWSAFRRRMFVFLGTLGTSLLFWLVYSFEPKFLIIDYARIASIASYLVIMAAGLGFQIVATQSKIGKLLLAGKGRKKLFQIVILIFFAVGAFFYTSREAWRYIILRYHTAVGVIEAPIVSPATNFLNEDDLALFADIKGARFVSIPWKALAIGAATGNFPVDNKASTITNFLVPANFFTEADCNYKGIYARYTKLRYAYYYPFDCPEFYPLGRSAENLVLYEFRPVAEVLEY